MIQNSLLKRQNANSNHILTTGMIEELKMLDSSNSTPVQNRTIISNVLTQLTKEAETAETANNKWKLNYDWHFELIRMIVYPLIKPLFSPKVMTLILINLEVMGNPLELINFDSIKPYFMGILTNIVIQIKDMINEMLYTWVVEKLSPLLTVFTLRLLMEQIEMYRKLVTDLLTACTIGGLNFNFNSNKKRVGIDDVNYVDINPELEKLKQTSISNTNC
jgi:hypothetical protein